MPDVRDAASSSIFGPSAAMHRSPRASGGSAASSPSRNSATFSTGFWYVPGSLTWSMNGRWLTPIPHRNRCPCWAVSAACWLAASSGECIQMLRIPVAIVTDRVAASRLVSGVQTSPPVSGIHSAE